MSLVLVRKTAKVSRKEVNVLLITRETDYALRILRALASGEKLTTPEICRREQLPLQFVYRILKKLETAGLVKIMRGADGGVMLAADLHEVNVYQLLVAVDDERNYINACMTPGYECPRSRANGDHCKVHVCLSSISASIDNMLRAQKLADILI